MLKPQELHVSRTVILYKLISGIIELILGISILLYGRNIVRFYNHFRFKELLEDPHDLLIRITDKVVAPLIIQHRVYLMFFLITLGIVKIIGAIGLLKGKEWGLDLLIVLFIVLLPFDLVALFSHPTFLKTVYFVLNFFIVLYLMEFKPQKHLRRLKKYVAKIKK